MEFDQEECGLNLMNAHLAVERSRAEEARKFLKKIKVAELAPGQAAVYSRLQGQTKIMLKRYRAGLKWLRKALILYEKDHATIPLHVERVRNWVGIAHYEQGNIAQALDEHHRCLKEIFENAIQDNRFRLKIYFNLGNDYLLLGQTSLALDFYREALNFATDDEDREDLASIYWGIGLAYLSKKDLDCARLHLCKSVALYVELHDLAQAARVRTQLGLVLIDLKEYAAAEQTLKEALEETRTAPEPDLIALSSAGMNLAFLYRRQERWAEAEELGATGLAYGEKLARPNLLLLGQAQAQQAEIKLGAGKEVEALALFELAAANIEKTGVVAVSREIFYRYGSALRRLGHFQKAYEFLTKAYLLTLRDPEPHLQPK